MSDSPSKYGGIAAVLVLGVGSLIIGFSLPPGQHEHAVELRWGGAYILLIGLLFTAISLSQTTALKALFVALGASVFCGTFIYFAASNEVTGTAKYHHNYLAKHDQGEWVTRESAPAKFRTATNVLWGTSVFVLASPLPASSLTANWTTEFKVGSVASRSESACGLT